MCRHVKIFCRQVGIACVIFRECKYTACVFVAGIVNFNACVRTFTKGAFSSVDVGLPRGWEYMVFSIQFVEAKCITIGRCILSSSRNICGKRFPMNVCESKNVCKVYFELKHMHEAKVLHLRNAIKANFMCLELNAFWVCVGVPLYVYGWCISFWEWMFAGSKAARSFPSWTCCFDSRLTATIGSILRCHIFWPLHLKTRNTFLTKVRSKPSVNIMFTEWESMSKF